MMSQKEAPSFLRAYCMYLCYRMRYSWGIPQGFLWDSQGLFDNSCWITGELLGYSWVFLGEPGVFLGEPGASQGIHVDFLGASQYFCYFIENNWELPGSFLGASQELSGSFLRASSELPGSFLGASWSFLGAFGRAYLGFQGASFCDFFDCPQCTYFDNSSKMSSTGLPIQPNSRHFSRSGTQTQSNLPTLARNTRILCLMNRLES